MRDFGILIPIRYDKHKMVYDALKKGVLRDIPEEKWLTQPECTGVITREDLLRVHSASYVDRLFSPETIDKEIIKTYELINPDGSYNRWAPEKATRPLKDLLTRALSTVAGTYACGLAALREHTARAGRGGAGFAYSLGGGMHHAQKDSGEGFCLINDVVISLRRLQAEGRVNAVWVIDTDAHKGDGTAALTWGDDSLRTLSIHMDRGWPLDGADYEPAKTYDPRAGGFNPSYTPSDIDIGIPEGEDASYVPRLGEGLLKLETLLPKPDMALVVGGVDPYEKDELASTKPLQLTKEMLLERDLLVYNFLQERGVPAAWITAGGYGPHSWEVYVNFLEHIMPRRLGQAGV